jgi:hypothetical protein
VPSSLGSNENEQQIGSPGTVQISQRKIKNSGRLFQKQPDEICLCWQEYQHRSSSVSSAHFFASSRILRPTAPIVSP